MHTGHPHTTTRTDTAVDVLVDGIVIAGRADIKNMVVGCPELNRLLKLRIVAVIDIQHAGEQVYFRFLVLFFFLLFSRCSHLFHVVVFLFLLSHLVFLVVLLVVLLSSCCSSFFSFLFFFVLFFFPLSFLF